ncbi:c-type cytochrome [Cohaesibacter celericrescens]|jgi:mono/diheme cytochrome c family protein|uniref:Cytochrome c domain-containing protein n=1 Tax=Cohaesibacter celericrescens TaxID=2067669 RepID=A0A2N5XNZ9_9HYPH|nr:cytochrome c [Cohaesibacter celericrescens]PLW76150.1 hypothetical protein C0081_14640 [Cohaesibacter celericrescens]
MARSNRKIRFAKSKNSVLILVLSISSLLLLLSNGGKIGGSDDNVLKRGLDSAQIRRDGMKLYIGNCLSCHGVHGRGTSFGPPLVHRSYGASELSDQAFAQAVHYGAPERLWHFGEMKPLKELSQVQVAQILAYVRAQQTDAEIR